LNYQGNVEHDPTRSFSYTIVQIIKRWKKERDSASERNKTEEKKEKEEMSEENKCI
jgi:hypothetical protein